jgi:hypothetical protein
MVDTVTELNLPMSLVRLVIITWSSTKRSQANFTISLSEDP